MVKRWENDWSKIGQRATKNEKPVAAQRVFSFRRKTTTRYAGEPEKVLLMRRKEKPPMIEW